MQITATKQAHWLGSLPEMLAALHAQAVEEEQDMNQFTRDEPFYIGDLNIYGYQATGFKRWNTWRASYGLGLAL